MASRTSVCNMAIGHLGIGTTISDIDTDQSAEAKACRRFYETVTKTAMRGYDWPFCTKLSSLGLLTERDVDATHPTTEWQFSYAYPSDCQIFKRIPSGARNDTLDSRVKYRILIVGSSKVILTDFEDALCEYVFYNETIEQWPADFVLAHSFLLASFVAPSITGGDPFKRGAAALQSYQWMINDAKSTSQNEEQRDAQPESEFTTGRE